MAWLASTQFPIEVISTGLPDIIAPVPYGHLDQVQVNEELTRAFCKRHDVMGLHAFEPLVTLPAEVLDKSLLS